MGYTVHGILQARILEWVAIPFSSGSSPPRDLTQVFRIAGRFFNGWATREAQTIKKNNMKRIFVYLNPFAVLQKLQYCKSIILQ